MEEINTYSFLIFILAGILTGIINTIAGSGTIVSMGSMILLGIPVELANTTNRLGVFFQNITGAMTVRRYDRDMHVKVPWAHTFSTLAGAMLGAVVAAHISGESLEVFILVIILLMIMYTLRDIYRPAQPGMKQLKIPGWLGVITFFGIGFYGGFLQVGVGIILLIGLRAVDSLQWNIANYLKLVMVLVYTIPTTLYFIWVDMILWIPGLMLGGGQVIGAFLAGWLFSVNPGLKRSIPFVVLGMLVITALRLMVD